MGKVYLGFDPRLEREVAIKVLHGYSEETAQRLRVEAKAAGRLNHPNIVVVHDIDASGGMLFVVMEYVRGITLEKFIKVNPRKVREQLPQIMSQVAAALDHAHEQQVVHRDVKPANIMIDGRGLVKVMDFGIAKMTADISVTPRGFIVGTPGYMAPEQINGQMITGRSDQYALGVMAYEVLTGSKPFEADTYLALFRKMGSAQEFAEVGILGCFPEGDEFGLGHSHSLSFQ